MDRISVLIGVHEAACRRKLYQAVAQQADMRVAGESASVLEAGRLAVARQPDVLLLHVVTAHAAGLEVLRSLRAKSPGTRAVLLGERGEGDFGAMALVAGAKGYLPAGATPDEVLDAIRRVASGGIWAPSSVLAKAVERLVEKTSSFEPYQSEGREHLTRREHEVVTWVALGKTNKEIAGQLGVSDQTVKTHLRNIFRKLEITRRSRLILQRS